MRAKLDKVVESTKCGKKGFELCKNVSEMDKYTSNATGKTHHVNHKVNYDDNCPVYLLSCKCCGEQYVGKTTGNVRYRQNN